MLRAQALVLVAVDRAHDRDALERGRHLGPLGRQAAAVAAPGRVELQQPHAPVAAGREALRRDLVHIWVAVVQPAAAAAAAAPAAAAAAPAAAPAAAAAWKAAAAAAWEPSAAAWKPSATAWKPSAAAWEAAAWKAPATAREPSAAAHAPAPLAAPCAPRAAGAAGAATAEGIPAAEKAAQRSRQCVSDRLVDRYSLQQMHTWACIAWQTVRSRYLYITRTSLRAELASEHVVAGAHALKISKGSPCSARRAPPVSGMMRRPTQMVHLLHHGIHSSLCS
jgi:hypothetical protein